MLPVERCGEGDGSQAAVTAAAGMNQSPNTYTHAPVSLAFVQLDLQLACILSRPDPSLDLCQPLEIG